MSDTADGWDETAEKGDEWKRWMAPRFGVADMHSVLALNTATNPVIVETLGLERDPPLHSVQSRNDNVYLIWGACREI